MLPNEIKISQLFDNGRLRDTDEFPRQRNGANSKLMGSALQGRIWRPDLLSVEGGTATALQSLATAGLDLRSLVMLYVNNELQFWLLQAGTAASNPSAGILRPADYNGTSNPRIWTRIL